MKKINCLQYCSMAVLIFISCFMGFGIFSITKASGLDSYISVIISTIVGIPLILLFNYISSYEKDLPLRDKIIKLYGKKIGFIFNVLLVILFLIMGVSIMFNLNNFIVSQFLPETPLYIVGIAFSMIIIYINIKGMETMSRVALIIIFINICLFLVACFSLLPKVSLDNFKPFLENGFSRTFNGVPYILSFNIIPIFLLLIIPKNNILKNNNLNKYLMGSYFLSMLIIFVFTFITLGILGIYLVSIYQYPEYIVLKQINLFNFVDRIENIITAQWIFGLFFTISFIIHFISNSIKYNNKSKSLVVLITSLILFLSIISFKNNTFFNNYIYQIVPFIALFLMIIIIIIGITIFIKNRFKLT